MLGGHLGLLVALGLQLDDLAGEHRDPLVERLEVRVLLLGRAPHRGHRARLEVGQRVVRVGGGELLEQVLAHPRGLLGHDLAQLVLDGARGLRPEQPLELLAELAVLRPEDVVDVLAEHLGDELGLLGERALDLARDLLELGPDEVGVDLGLLAREHAGADLDRVGQQLGGIAARGDPLADELDRDAVAHGERVGDDGVAEQADAGGSEWGGGLHGVGGRYAGVPTERASADVEPAQRPPAARPRPRARSTSACPGPARHSATSCSTASSEPSKTASTVPSPQVARPARHAGLPGRPPDRVAEEDALHAPVGAHPLAHGHGRVP